MKNSVKSYLLYCNNKYCRLSIYKTGRPLFTSFSKNNILSFSCPLCNRLLVTHREVPKHSKHASTTSISKDVFRAIPNNPQQSTKSLN